MFTRVPRQFTSEKEAQQTLLFINVVFYNIVTDQTDKVSDKGSISTISARNAKKCENGYAFIIAPLFCFQRENILIQLYDKLGVQSRAPI